MTQELQVSSTQIEGTGLSINILTPLNLRHILHLFIKVNPIQII